MPLPRVASAMELAVSRTLLLLDNLLSLSPGIQAPGSITSRLIFSISFPGNSLLPLK